jgi:FkbM family methyltransferase
MNPIWLLRNARNAWQHSVDVPSFIARLLWCYSSKLPAWVFAEENIIPFRYPTPVGDVTFNVRNNKGSDGFIFGEVFDHRYYDLGLDRAPETILDLGANAGFTTVYFQRSFPKAKIACVEPMPNNIQVLRINLALNHVDAEVFPAAVAVTDGSIQMEIGEKDYGHRVAESQASRQTVKTLSVPAITVPSICRKLGWQRVGLLKVDIEGHEKELFAADCSWLHCVDAMCIECHNGFGAEQLSDLAKNYGFAEPRQLPGIWLLARPAE